MRKFGLCVWHGIMLSGEGQEQKRQQATKAHKKYKITENGQKWFCECEWTDRMYGFWFAMKE